MSDTISTNRPGPNVSSPPLARRPEDRIIEIAPSGAAETVPALVPEPVTSNPVVSATDSSVPRPEAGLDQLSRIEDKTARIEEKYARSEARMQRVVDKVDAAMDRFSHVALQSDLSAVRGEIGIVNRRVKNLPGFRALLLTSVVSAILTAAVIILLFKYGGGFLTPVR